MRIRGGAGLGDSLYLRPFVAQFVSDGMQVEVCTHYPEVFAGIHCRTAPFSRANIDRLIHYTHGKQNPNTTQYRDLQERAMISPPLCFTWNISSKALILRMRRLAGDRPIVLVIGGRPPMDRVDGFGMELLPRRDVFQRAIDTCDAFTVRIGRGAKAYDLRCDLDLWGKTSVSDIIDLASVCDGVIGQCSFAVPLAEGFGKPFLAIWASAGLRATHPYVRSITPRKILEHFGKTSFALFDLDHVTTIDDAIRSFRVLSDARQDAL